MVPSCALPPFVGLQVVHDAEGHGIRKRWLAKLIGGQLGQSFVREVGDGTTSK